MARGIFCSLMLICFSGVPPALAQETEESPIELIFPIVHSRFVEGAVNLQTTFTFLNLSDSTAQGTFRAYESNGTPKRILDICSPDPWIDPDLDDVDKEIEIRPAGSITLRQSRSVPANSRNSPAGLGSFWTSPFRFKGRAK